LQSYKEDINIITNIETNLILLLQKRLYNIFSPIKFNEITDKNIKKFKNGFSIIGECWIWNGASNKDGYGQIKINKKSISVSRFSYFLHNKIDPYGLMVCHSCHNKMCVNPKHLYLGSSLHNSNDSHKNHGRPSKISLEEIQDLLGQGLSKKEIANKLGCT